MNETKTAEDYRADAARNREQAAESWERSDTDGFLSQWASGKTAQLNDAKARLMEQGKRDDFPGLYEGDRRVAARLITTQFGTSWLLDETRERDLHRRRGKVFLPNGLNGRSRVLKQLGLRVRRELAPAWVKMEGRGTGLSGTCWVETFRTGDKWGFDAELIPEENEACSPDGTDPCSHWQECGGPPQV